MAQVINYVDVEMAESSTEDELVPAGGAQPAGRSMRRRLLIAGAGLLALLAGAALLAPALGHGHGDAGDGSVSARQLLESPTLADVATDQLMSMGARVLRDAQRPAVREIVVRGFRNITRDARNAERLGRTRVTPAQREALTNAVRHTGDPRMQKIGKDIAHALADGRSEGREGAAKRVRAALAPHLGELRMLRDEVLPPALRGGEEGGAQGQSWAVDVDVDSMRVMRTLPSKWNVEVDMSRPQQSRRLAESVSKPMLKLEESMGVLGAFFEQARVLMDNMDVLDNMMGDKIHIPDWSESLVGALDFGSELVSCVVDAGSDMTMMMLCPARYASAGADALRSVKYAMGFRDPKTSKAGAAGAATGATGAIGAAGSVQQPATQSKSLYPY